nr:immunoglobulin heavy chain junction region [Mus musculus]
CARTGTGYAMDYW